MEDNKENEHHNITFQSVLFTTETANNFCATRLHPQDPRTTLSPLDWMTSASPDMLRTTTTISNDLNFLSMDSPSPQSSSSSPSPVVTPKAPMHSALRRLSNKDRVRRRLSLSADFAYGVKEAALKSTSFPSPMAADVDEMRFSPPKIIRTSAEGRNSQRSGVPIIINETSEEEEEEDEELASTQPLEEVQQESSPSFSFPHQVTASARSTSSPQFPSKTRYIEHLDNLAPLRRSTSSFSLHKPIPTPWDNPDLQLSVNHPKQWVTKMKETRIENKDCLLPTITGSHPDLNCITPETTADLLNGLYDHIFTRIYVIDCRFPYEFDGGHIQTAINLTEEEVRERFMNVPITNEKTAIVFHCEFSSKRAPSSYRALRNLDRAANVKEYPKLFYPDLYVIEGGYKNFWETFPGLCDGTYVEMRDERHSQEMKQHVKNCCLKRSRSFSLQVESFPFRDNNNDNNSNTNDDTYT